MVVLSLVLLGCDAAQLLRHLFGPYRPWRHLASALRRRLPPHPQAHAANAPTPPAPPSRPRLPDPGPASAAGSGEASLAPADSLIRPNSSSCSDHCRSCPELHHPIRTGSPLDDLRQPLPGPALFNYERVLSEVEGKSEPIAMQSFQAVSKQVQASSSLSATSSVSAYRLHSAETLSVIASGPVSVGNINSIHACYPSSPIAIAVRSSQTLTILRALESQETPNVTPTASLIAWDAGLEAERETETPTSSSLMAGLHSSSARPFSQDDRSTARARTSASLRSPLA